MDLSRYDQESLINVLSERAAFERIAVRLYDSIVRRVRGSEGAADLLPALIEYRNQEEEHALWIEELIRRAGWSPDEETENAELVARESFGIESVIQSGEPLPHAFHALLAAELMDNAGWDILIDLATEAGDDSALPDLERRRDEEEDHLEFVRDAVATYTSARVILTAEYDDEDDTEEERPATSP